MSFLRHASLARALRAPIKPTATGSKVQSAKIHNVKLVQLHDTLHSNKEQPLQLHGLRLHEQIRTEATSSVSPSNIARELRAGTACAGHESEFRDIHGRVRDTAVPAGMDKASKRHCFQVFLHSHLKALIVDDRYLLNTLLLTHQLLLCLSWLQQITLPLTEAPLRRLLKSLGAETQVQLTWMQILTCKVRSKLAWNLSQ